MVNNRWVCSYINIRSSSVNLHFSYTPTVYYFPITAQFLFTPQQFTKTKHLYGCLTSQVVLGSMHWCSMMPCQLHDKTSQGPNWWPTRQTCDSFLLSKSDHPYVTVSCYVGVPLAWSSSLSLHWEVSCGLDYLQWNLPNGVRAIASARSLYRKCPSSYLTKSWLNGFWKVSFEDTVEKEFSPRLSSLDSAEF